jgi:hypothetical protein
VATYRIIVVHDDEVVEAQVASEGERFLADAFLQAAVAAEAPDLVVDDVEAGLVVGRGEVLGCHGEADGVRDALAQEPSRELLSH